MPHCAEPCSVPQTARVFGGYFLQPNLIPLGFSWVDIIAYVKYAIADQGDSDARCSDH